MLAGTRDRFSPSLSAALLLAVLAWPPAGAALGLPAAVLALAALVAERQSVRLTSRAEVSAAALPIILSAVIYGPLAAIFVSIVSLLPSFERPYARWLTWTSTRSIAVVARASLPSRFRVVSLTQSVAYWRPSRRRRSSSRAARRLGVGYRRCCEDVPAREIRLASTIFLAMPLYMPVAALMVYAYRQVSPWSVVLLPLPGLRCPEVVPAVSRTAGNRRRAHASHGSPRAGPPLVCVGDGSDARRPRRVHRGTLICGCCVRPRYCSPFGADG